MPPLFALQQGTLQDPDTLDERPVVLKRVKARVAGAEEMHEAEHLINVLASKAAGPAVAPFLGYALVETPVGVCWWWWGGALRCIVVLGWHGGWFGLPCTCMHV